MTHATPKKKMRKSKIVGVTAGAMLLVGGIAGAAYAATTLITIDGTTVVASEEQATCQTSTLATTLGATVYNPATKNYDQNSFTISNIDADCNGHQMKVTLYAANGAVVNFNGTAQQVVTISGTSVNFTGNVDHAVKGIAVTIAN